MFKRIPKHLLPVVYHKKYTYSISKIGVVKRSDGKIMKSYESPNGFGHPIVLQRNAWFLAAMAWKVPNPDNHPKVVEVNGRVVWISSDEYYAVMKELYGMENPKAKLSQYKAERIIKDVEAGVSKAAIARNLGISRTTVYRVLRGNK